MEGWIKLHRRLIKHWIWSNDQYLKGWIYCLFRANHESNKILIGSKLETLEPGQFITSIGNFSKDTGMSAQATRTFWALLKTDEMINKESTSHSTKITICKYDDYQNSQQTNNKQVTNQQQTNSKQATTDKNVKNDNNEKEFKEEVLSFSNEYEDLMLIDFFNYWSEWNKSKTKMRWQMEKTWQTDRRISTWLKRSSQFNKGNVKSEVEKNDQSNFEG